MLSTSSTAVVPAPSRLVQSSTRPPGTPQTVKDVTKNAGSVASTPPPPGTFRHPRMTEIISRRSKNSFTKKNVRIAVVNTVAIFATFVASSTLYSALNWLISFASLNDLPIRASFLINFFRIFLLSNVILALRPVLPYISKTDAVSDIPLTPTQRALLGLPVSRQPTPISNEGTAKYITPPRYRRSSTSLTSTPQSNNGFSTDRRSISANYSSSPLSTSRLTLGFSPSPQFQSSTRRASGSPFSPSSPLLHKAFGARGDIGESFNQSTSSFGLSTSTSGILLGRSQSLKERGVGRRGDDDQPSTPSPGSKRVQPGLNYKWLYDKGYRSPLDG